MAYPCNPRRLAMVAFELKVAGSYLPRNHRDRQGPKDNKLPTKTLGITSIVNTVIKSRCKEDVKKKKL
jgi:hypothetical protein